MYSTTTDPKTIPKVGICGIPYFSRQMQEALSRLESIARTHVRVNVIGKTGTGKELVARDIHDHSPRKDKTFYAVNSAVRMSAPLRNELLGHERGGYTGADKTQKGILETANHGTVFFDEIEEMDEDIQSALLRALEYGYERVGGVRIIKPDVRIITASKQPLREAVEQGRLRDDLYYRIRGEEIILPSLREREGDIEYLAKHFCKDFSKGTIDISQDGLDFLNSYHWPGNVRELRSVIEHAVMLNEGQKPLTKRDFERYILQASSIIPSSISKEIYQIVKRRGFEEVIGILERELTELALAESNDMQTKAAKELGISFRQIRYLISKYKREKINPKD